MYKRSTIVALMISLVLLLLCQVAYAAPAYPGVIQVTDADGRTLAIRNHGDEFFSYMTDTEGNVIYGAKDGRYYYVVHDGDAFALGDMVGDADAQDTRQHVKATEDFDTLKEKLIQLRNVMVEFAASMFTLEDDAANARLDYPDDYSPNLNTKDPLRDVWVPIDSDKLPANPPKADTCALLVLKISFADVKCLYTDDMWHKRVFDDGISDYYTKVSNGKFTYVEAKESYVPQNGRGSENDGVIHVTLPIARPEYRHYDEGDNFSNGACVGIYPTTVDGKELEFALVNDASLIAYALKYADPYIDFSQYDTNNDGYISPTELAVMAVLAGYEAAMGASGDMPRTWAHSYQFNTWHYALDQITPTGERAVIGSAGCVNLDGKNLYKYTAIGENINISFDYGAPPSEDNPPVQATIGTPCHELGHDLGLMDLYDITYSPQECEVLGLSLMAQGNYGSDPSESMSWPGSSPTLLDPYSKILLGFYDATVVTEAGLYYLNEASNSQDYNILRIDTDDRNVYYLIENRTMTGYDRGLLFYGEEELYTGGLVYWRIDQAIVDANWESDSVNVTSGSYGIMPVYVAFSNVDGDYTGTNPFWFNSMKGVPVGGSNYQLFSFEETSARMPLMWGEPLPLSMTPDASFTEHMAADTRFKIGADGLTIRDLVKVLLNGTPLNPDTDYDAENGSIIIKLKQSFLNTLAPGTYTLQALLTGGRNAVTNIHVNDVIITPPKTGDDASPLLWAGLALLAGGCLVILCLKRKRHK